MPVGGFRRAAEFEDPWTATLYTVAAAAATVGAAWLRVFPAIDGRTGGCGTGLPMGKGDMAVVGLTGGIASGKSVVAARMVERGVAVIDADRIARDIVEPGRTAWTKIREAFGPDVFQADGQLDRKALGRLVFAHEDQLAILNAITHPEIMAEAGRQLLSRRREGHPWVVYEAALILENDLAPGMDALVAVISEPETQISRILARDGLDESQARRRLQAQTHNAHRRSRADYLLENTGTLAALRENTDGLCDALDLRFAPAGPITPER